MLSGKELEFEHSKRMVEEYRLKAKKGFAWAVITISPDGRFNAQSDYGSFSYRWGSFGDDFKQFLIRIMSECKKEPIGYLYDKIHSSERHGRVDVEQTIQRMKKKIIEKRKEDRYWTMLPDCLTESDARELWDQLDDVRNSHDEITMDAFATIFYHEINVRAKRNVFHEEDIWYGDIIVTAYDRQAAAFCKYIAPAFANILKEEIEQVAVIG